MLIAGKGHENFQIIGDERLPLDDREVAREWLYESRLEPGNESDSAIGTQSPNS